MSDATPQSRSAADDETDLGSLSIEDDPEGTVDPAELAGTAGSSDDDVLHAEHTEEDLED